MSFQLKGTPVAMGVVNRLDSVTTISTGLVGSHATAGVVAASASAAAQKTLLMSSPSVGASGGHLDGDDAATDVRKLDLTAVKFSESAHGDCPHPRGLRTPTSRV